MRYKHFLLEGRANLVVDDDNYDEIIRTIRKDCQYYLNNVNKKYKRHPLFRGMKSEMIYDGELGVVSVRKDRKPRGMNKYAYVFFNQWLESLGHSRRDKSISVNINDKFAGIFGSIYVIFPIGKFDYTWAETFDINYENRIWKPMEIEKMMWNGGAGESGYFDPELTEKYEKLIHTNKDITKAISRGYEIWFNCEKYYIITYDTFKEIKNEL